jgi:hypothetical protein
LIVVPVFSGVCSSSAASITFHPASQPSHVMTINITYQSCHLTSSRLYKRETQRQKMGANSICGRLSDFANPSNPIDRNENRLPLQSASDSESSGISLQHQSSSPQFAIHTYSLEHYLWYQAFAFAFGSLCDLDKGVLFRFRVSAHAQAEMRYRFARKTPRRSCNLNVSVSTLRPVPFFMKYNSAVSRR